MTRPSECTVTIEVSRGFVAEFKDNVLQKLDFLLRCRIPGMPWQTYIIPMVVE